MASQDSLSAILHLQGLPPLPKSLTANYTPEPPTHPMPMHKPTPSYGRPASAHAGFVNPVMASSVSLKGIPQGPPPRPPPRPNSRTRASSTNSSFRTSPENRTPLLGLGSDGKRSSPLSLSSSPYPDSGVGRSSADSMSEPKAFVRVVKAPQSQEGDPKLEAQLSQLRKDMQHLRQQDMALLGHLLQIHQGIQDLRHILVPPPQPAPSSVTPLSMFQSTPSYTSRQLRKQSHPPSSSSSFSKLSMFQGANKFFSRRSSADKLSSDAMKMNQELGACGGLGTGGSYRMAREDDMSDSLSSLEFGDV